MTIDRALKRLQVVHLADDRRALQPQRRHHRIVGDVIEEHHVHRVPTEKLQQIAAEFEVGDKVHFRPQRRTLPKPLIADRWRLVGASSPPARSGDEHPLERKRSDRPTERSPPLVKGIGTGRRIISQKERDDIVAGGNQIAQLGQRHPRCAVLQPHRVAVHDQKNALGRGARRRRRRFLADLQQMPDQIFACGVSQRRFAPRFGAGRQ